MASNVVKWLVVGSVPALAFVVGAIALPRPLPVSAEKDQTRQSLGAAVSRIAPSLKAPIDAELGDGIKVLGADCPTVAMSRGSRMSCRFFFEATGEIDRDWMVFLHIDAKAGSYRIHGDHDPVNGKYKTTLWQAGDYIADEWSTIVPRDAPAGVYDVWLGFYAGEERLEWTGGNPAVHDGNNRVRVAQIVIE